MALILLLKNTCIIQNGGEEECIFIYCTNKLNVRQNQSYKNRSIFVARYTHTPGENFYEGARLHFRIKIPPTSVVLPQDARTLTRRIYSTRRKYNPEEKVKKNRSARTTRFSHDEGIIHVKRTILFDTWKDRD